MIISQSGEINNYPVTCQQLAFDNESTNIFHKNANYVTFSLYLLYYRFTCVVFHVRPPKAKQLAQLCDLQPSGPYFFIFFRAETLSETLSWEPLKGCEVIQMR